MYQIRLIQSFTPFATTPIYTPQTQDTLPVETARCTMELNEGGNLEFVLPFGHPYYDSLTPLSSYLQVVDDSEEIFYGRIWDRSDPTLTGRITYQAEGALSFLQDSEVSPESRDSEGNYNSRTLTAEAFFRWCIAQHNADVNDPRRQFTVGVVTASRKNETDEYQITSYTETKTAISQYILDRYGGFLRVRVGNNGTHYIDWVQDYGVTNPQPVEIGSNITDQTNAISGDGVFTVLRPVGANGLTLSPSTINVFPAEKVAEYGRIVKSVTFQDADTAEKLRARANAYISRIEKKLTKECQVSLVDFHFLDGSIQKIRLGHMFSNIYGLEGETMTVFSMDQDLIRVDKGQYTLKNKKDLDAITDGRVKGGSISKASARSSRAGGLALKYYHEATDEASIEVKKLNLAVGEMHGSIEQLNIDVSGTAEIAAGAMELSTNNYERLSHVEGTTEELSEAVYHDLTVSVRSIEGTGVIQNSEAITTFAGSFEIWEDQATHKKTVHLKDGAEFAVDKANGDMMTVGTELEFHEQLINNHSTFISTVEGSALWTQKDHITGVSGEFDIELVPDPDNPGEFLKKIVIKSGGGIVISRDNTQFGLYDEGTLTGGIVVDKINHETQTAITGDHIVIGQRTDSGVSKDIKLIATDSMEIGLVTVNQNGEPVLEAGTKIYRKDGNIYNEYGIYDEKTLTGGLIVNKINGQVSTQIKGELIKIGELNDKDLDTWASEAKSGTGVFAKFLTVQRLTAQEIETLLANIGLAHLGSLEVGEILVTKDSGIGEIHADLYSGINMQLTGDIDLDSGGIYAGDSIDTGTGFYDASSGESLRLNVVDAKVSGNVLTITYADGTTQDFSKATSLSGDWGSPPTGTLTVNATQNGTVVDSFVRIFTHSLPYVDEDDENKIKMKVQTIDTATTPPTYTDTGHIINLGLYLQDKTGDNKITTNGTYEPDMNAYKIGFGKVVVDVDASVTGAWEESNPVQNPGVYNKYTARKGSGAVALSETISTSMAYNSTLHKYTVTVSSMNQDSTSRTVITDEIADTDAVNYGKANSSITTVWEQSNPLSSSNPYNRFNVKREGTSVKTQDITATLTYNSTLHKYTATVDATDKSGIYSVELADTDAVNYGKANSSVTVAWVQSNPSVSSNPYNKLQVSREGSVVASLSQTISSTMSYDSTNHKYKVSIGATGREVILTDEIADTDAVNYGKANSSITTVWEQSNPSVSSNPYNRFNVKREGTSVKTQDITATLTYNSTLHKYTATVDATDKSGIYSVELADTDGWNRGYGDAHLSGSWDKTSSSLTNNNRITISKVSSGSSNSLNYIISAAASISYNSNTHKYTATAKAKVDGTQRGDDATYTGGTEAYDAGYLTGWNGFWAPAWYIPTDTAPQGMQSGRFYVPNTKSSASDTLTYQEWTRATNGWNNAVANAKAAIKNAYTNSAFDTTANYGFEVGTRKNTYTDATFGNCGFYYISGSGNSARYGMVVRGRWTVEGSDIDAYSYLESTPTDLYRKGYKDGGSGGGGGFTKVKATWRNGTLTVVASDASGSESSYVRGFSTSFSNPILTLRTMTQGTPPTYEDVKTFDITNYITSAVSGYGWPGAGTNDYVTVTRYGSNTDLVLTMDRSGDYIRLRNNDGGLVARLYDKQGSGDTYSSRGSFKCTNKTTSGGLTTYTFTNEDTNSSKFNSGSSYTFYVKT